VSDLSPGPRLARAFSHFQTEAAHLGTSSGATAPPAAKVVTMILSPEAPRRMCAPPRPRRVVAPARRVSIDRSPPGAPRLASGRRDLAPA
jgi:hypothetical protein